MFRRVGRSRKKVAFVWDFLRPDSELSQSNEQLTYILNAARNSEF